MPRPRAAITGITGQDGSYLAEFLLARGYEVYGLVRKMEAVDLSWIGHLARSPEILNQTLFLHQGEVNDSAALHKFLARARPQEIYHLAAQSHVGRSSSAPEHTCEITGMATLRLLEVIRTAGLSCRLFNASSSEIFGKPKDAPQDEQTPLQPVTVYGCAKAFSTHLLRSYRETFKMFACNGILYNHESPRRGVDFVTQKICLGAAAIKQGRAESLTLGNTSAERDWGDARDYVQGMWLALQNATAEDFVFATGELHTVQEIVETAFGALGLDWRKYVKHDPSLLRPEEPARLVGNPAKAERVLGWRRTRTFPSLVAEMTLEALKN
jgi:GDPmannose 4,6-dehydratase